MMLHGDILIIMIVRRRFINDYWQLLETRLSLALQIKGFLSRVSAIRFILGRAVLGYKVTKGLMVFMCILRSCWRTFLRRGNVIVILREPNAHIPSIPRRQSVTITRTLTQPHLIIFASPIKHPLLLSALLEHLTEFLPLLINYEYYYYLPANGESFSFKYPLQG